MSGAVSSSEPKAYGWSRPLGMCTLYTCMCALCAAADVKDHLEPGSWLSHLAISLCCGFCTLCRIMKDRSDLAAKYNVNDTTGSFCHVYFCASCLLAQELHHIEDRAQAVSGGMGAAPAGYSKS